MRPVLNPYFYILLLVGALVYIGQRLGIRFPFFIQNYLNDLLILPIVLWVILEVLKRLKGNHVKISWPLALSITLYYSVFFEWYLPRFHPRYTADFLDVLSYFIGTFIFMYFHKKADKLS